MGGVVYNYNKLTIINNSAFTNNKASRGSVIYSKADLIIHDSNFENNNVLYTYGILGILSGNVSISHSIFKSNTGSDEGGVIFNLDGDILINDSQFISNKALSYGGPIDNSGNLTVINSLFDKNQANGAGAIDNGGNLTIIKSNFTNNKANKNGGAIDNNHALNVVGSIFVNNVAGKEGGAIIARKDINITHSALFNNKASEGDAIYINHDNSNFTDNWWGSNNPNFKDLINKNIPKNFTWIIMGFKSTTKIMQYEKANLVVSFNQITDGEGTISDLESSDKLPMLKVVLSIGTTLNVANGYISKTLSIPKVSSITAKLHNQTRTLSAMANPAKIVNNRNIVVDYGSKAIFKVRLIGNTGKVVGMNEVVVMKIAGKTYKVKTNKFGYALKTFSLRPGKYSIISIYKGAAVKNTITVKNVLKAINKSVKKSKVIKYSVTLKTSKGKAIPAKKITFKIKGKLYNAKTNKKGIATVNLKNFKVGKYVVVVKYLNYQIKRTINVIR